MKKEKRKSKKNLDAPPLSRSTEERLMRFSNSAHQEERRSEAEDLDTSPAPQVHGKIGQALGVLIFVFLFVMALALVYFIFTIDTIEVLGCEKYNAQEIAGKSGVTLGAHMWLTDMGKAEQTLERDPYIQSATITRVYPSKVTITVRERKEAAVIAGLGTAAVIDKQGYVLSIGNREGYDGLIRVYGAGSAGYQLGQKMGEESDFVYRTLVSMLGAIEEYELAGMIESIDLSNALAIKMTTFSGYTVQMGQDSDIPSKVYKLYIVLPALESLGYTGGTLNVSVRGDPVYSPPETEPGNAAQQPGSEDPEADDPQEGDQNPDAQPEGDLPEDGAPNGDTNEQQTPQTGSPDPEDTGTPAPQAEP